MIDTSNLKELFVVGRPRSGTVWLNRLLADALDSPLEALGDMAEEAKYFGPGRDGGFVIRKSHDEILRGPTVFIQRDPRDVAVSIMHFRNQTELFPIVKQMCEPYENSYEFNIRKWLDTLRAEFYTRYELLHRDAISSLRMTVKVLARKRLSNEKLAVVVKRQSFATVKASDTTGRLSNSMHSGKVGSWKSHFTREIGEYMQQHLGNFMFQEGYTQDKNWMKELP